jgi:FMN phosphatase YigB (HAD superfamily)
VPLKCSLSIAQNVRGRTESFLQTLDGLALIASDLLFIDDSQMHVSAATALGMAAPLARHPGEARSVLVDYGVVL